MIDKQVTDEMIEAGTDTYDRMLGNYTIDEIVEEIYLAMRSLEPPVGDELVERLRKEAARLVYAARNRPIPDATEEILAALLSINGRKD